MMNRALLFSIFCVLCIFPASAIAQQGQILSVTPPLFQLSVDPGDIWASNLKVVNGNPYELTVYVDIVNFAPSGEGGQGTFIPNISGDDSGATLASWIEINNGPHIIPPEQSAEIPFFVEVPEDASPGGHFAAALVGTQPPQAEDTLIVRTAQVVTSLFFARIEGDIIEEAGIREFSVEDSFTDVPEANFSLRFENKGNVHLLPRGFINITNMWGKERGVIPINQQTHFGNVLPESIRDFKFSWKGERSVTEIGRYKAEVVLAYGENGIKNTTAATYFWVIPVKATLITLGLIVGFIWFVAWSVRLYVRRMLMLAGVDTETASKEEGVHVAPASDVKISSYKNVSAPIRKGALDLRSRLASVSAAVDFCKVIFEFVLQYKRFFVIVLILAIGFTAISVYVSDVSTDQKGYEVTIDREGSSTMLNSEEVLKDQLAKENTTTSNPDQHFDLLLYNESGEAGIAATAAVLLEDAGYVVAALETNLERTRSKTVVVYDDGLYEEASALSAMFDNVLISSSQILSDDVGKVKIFFGNDQRR